MKQVVVTAPANGDVLRRLWVSCLAAVVLGLSAVAVAEPLSRPDVLRLVTHEFPPFSQEQDGEVSGPARALIDRVCKELQVRCEHQLLPWARAQARVRRGDADGMYVIGWNRERSRWLHFSTPLLRTEYGVFVKADNPLLFNGGNSLAGYTVGVYGPSNTARALQDLLREHPDTFRIEQQGDTERLLRQLSLGRLDAVYSNRDVGFALMRDHALSGIRYAGHHKSLKYYVGFSQQRTDANWNQRFSQAYKQLEARGVVRDILLSFGLTP